MTDGEFGSKLEWRSLSPDDLQREYSPSSCVGGNIAPFLDEYSDRSDQSRQWCAEAGIAVRTLEYGPLPSQSVDIAAPANEKAPIVVFIHGGYWQQLSKRESFGPASDFVDRGIAFAAIDYTLAPKATLDEIVAECRSAIAAIHTKAANLNIDPNRIVVAGSSAGAHLAAMVTLDPDLSWRPAAMVLLSGVYELEPLLGTSVNDAVGLSLAAAHRNSPARLPVSEPVPSVIAWGANETDQFKRQSRQFADLLGDAGHSPTVLEAADRNHFNIVGDLGRTETAVGASVAQLIESTRENNAHL